MSFTTTKRSRFAATSSPASPASSSSTFCTSVAATLGVDLRFQTNISELNELADCDLLVGADGVNSLVRRTYRRVLSTVARYAPEQIHLVRDAAIVPRADAHLPRIRSWPLHRACLQIQFDDEHLHHRNAARRRGRAQALSKSPMKRLALIWLRFSKTICKDNRCFQTTSSAGSTSCW